MKWNGLTPAKQLVGIDNYIQVFAQDLVFWQAVRNAVLWTVLPVVFQAILEVKHRLQFKLSRS